MNVVVLSLQAEEDGDVLDYSMTSTGSSSGEGGNGATPAATTGQPVATLSPGHTGASPVSVTPGAVNATPSPAHITPKSLLTSPNRSDLLLW